MPRQPALQHHEARARQLRRRLEIHEARAPRRARNAASASNASSRVAPKRWCSTLPCSSAPTGTSSSGMFGMSAAHRRSAVGLALLGLGAGSVVLQRRHLGHQRLRRAPRPSRLRLRRSPSTRVAPLLRGLARPDRRRGAGRRARAIQSAIGSRPRWRRPSSKASGFSRMARMSCMGAALAIIRAGRKPASGRGQARRRARRCEAVGAAQQKPARRA